MLVDVTFDCLHPRMSKDPNDQYRALMALPGMVEIMEHPRYRLPPLDASITACGEWVVLAEEYFGLVWLKSNRPAVFKRLIPDGLVTVDIHDGPRFSDRPCTFLTCV